MHIAAQSRYALWEAGRQLKGDRHNGSSHMLRCIPSMMSERTVGLTGKVNLPPGRHLSAELMVCRNRKVTPATSVARSSAVLTGSATWHTTSSVQV